MAQALTRGCAIDAEILQLHPSKSDNKSIEATASNLPITIGTKTYQIDEDGNLVISEAESFWRMSIIVPTAVALFIVLTLSVKARFFPNAQGSTSFMIRPIFTAAIVFALLRIFSPRLQTIITRDGYTIWYPKDKYPPDKITDVRVKKEMWHDYGVVVESELEKRNVSGTVYKGQAEQVQKLIQDFLNAGNPVTE